MKNLFLSIVILLPLVACNKASDTPPAIIGHEFNTRILDGYFVTSIAFDKLGNAWMGTFKQGLIKYNAGEVTVYHAGNSTLSDTSVIHDVAIDSKNNVWIGCDGLMKFDGNTFTHYHSANTPMPEDYVSAIAIDAKDNVWFSSSRFQKGGVVKYDGANWTVYTPDNSDLPANFVRSIAIGKNDEVWLALNEVVNHAFLAKISGDNWTVYTHAGLGFTPYYLGNIQIDSKNRLCGANDFSLSSLLANNGPQVFIFNGASSEKLQFDNTSIVRFITVDNQDNIWCGLYGGYSVYNGVDWKVKSSRFQNEGVFAIEQSPDGRIWIGTGDGVYVSD
jgi:ligand-binding sensor domain-containing protein